MSKENISQHKDEQGSKNVDDPKASIVLHGVSGKKISAAVKVKAKKKAKPEAELAADANLLGLNLRWQRMRLYKKLRLF